ncbi:hypothetical protein TruAng_004360 [Truncatella angustata]|nr:hypothetical protein TruAng_004360 [Truncatella angustata]
MAQESQLIKVDIRLYKKDEVPYEDFIKWATEVYPTKAIPLMKKHGLVKWTTTAFPPHFREPFRHALKEEMGRPEWVVPDHDLVMSYWVRSLDSLQALTTSREWDELEVDAQKITNVQIGQFAVGHEIVQFQDNWAGGA